MRSDEFEGSVDKITEAKGISAMLFPSDDGDILIEQDVIVRCHLMQIYELITRPISAQLTQSSQENVASAVSGRVDSR